MSVHRYRLRRVPELDVVQWTGDNIDEVREIVPAGKLRYATGTHGSALYVATGTYSNRRWTHVMPGQYVTRDAYDHDHHEVDESWHFDALYEEVIHPDTLAEVVSGSFQVTEAIVERLSDPHPLAPHPESRESAA